MFSTAGLILAPAMLWGWVFYHSHRYKQTRLLLLLLLFAGGFLSGLLALVLNHSIEKYTAFWPGARFPYSEIMGQTFHYFSAGFWMMVGVNEELAKLVILLLLVYSSHHLEEAFDGILYVAVIALGFATIENWFYLEQYGVPVIISRSIITLPAHAFMSVPMGLMVAKSKIHLKEHQNVPHTYYIPMLWILCGWMYSALLHGGYDLLLSLNLEYYAYGLVLMMGLQTALLGREALKRSKLIPQQNFTLDEAGKT